jgi:amino acid transporter
MDDSVHSGVLDFTALFRKPRSTSGRTRPLTQTGAPITRADDIRAVAGGEIRARDGGLVRGIGPWALAASVVNGVVGAGIFSLPASMARAAGDLAPLAYVLCAVAMGAVVTCFAEAGSRVPTSGGAYGYVEAAFGRLPGFVAGMLIWASSVLACGGIAAAVADTLVEPSPLAGVWRAAVILGVIGVIALVNLRGVRGAARLVAGATAIKLIPLLFFVVAGALVAPGIAPASAAPAVHTDFGRALILALFAFCGMETPLGASGEVRDPARTLPRALGGAMLCVLLLYVAIQLVAQRLLGAGLAQAAAPLADAASRIAPGAGLLLLAGATLSMASWIGSDILGAPRLLFAFARDGRLPGFLGRLSADAHVPANAIIVHASLAAALALSGSFVQLAVLSTLDTAALYALACAAAWVIHRRRLQLAGGSLHIRMLPLASGLGIVSMLALIGVARPIEIAGLFATIAVSMLIFAAMGRIAPGDAS